MLLLLLCVIKQQKIVQQNTRLFFIEKRRMTHSFAAGISSFSPPLDWKTNKQTNDSSSNQSSSFKKWKCLFRSFRRSLRAVPFRRRVQKATVGGGSGKAAWRRRRWADARVCRDSSKGALRATQRRKKSSGRSRCGNSCCCDYVPTVTATRRRRR